MAGPFEWVNAITQTKKDLVADDPAATGYVPFIINKALSYWHDTVLFANEMNKRSAHLSAPMQFRYLLNTVRSRKRFAKWHKGEDERLSLITAYYKCSVATAKQYIALMNDDDIEEIKSKLSKGGIE